MTSSTSDVRLAIRSLGRSPLFATVAILSLALGIGANTAIFTLIDQIVLRKLPVQRTRAAGHALPAGRRTTAATWARGCTRIRCTRTSRRRPSRSPRCSAGGWSPASVSVDNQTERLEAELVSGNYFTMLGVKPALGRRVQFAGGRSGLPGPSGRGPQLHYWVNRFARDPRRRRQEDPGQQLPDDDRRRLGGGLRRHRSGALAADPRAGPDEAGDAARVAVAAHGRPARALGAGVRAG